MHTHSTYSKLRFLASQYHEAASDVELEAIASWFEPAFTRLVDANQDAAVELILDYGSLLSSAQASRVKRLNLDTLSQMIDKMLNVPRVLPLHEAKVTSLLAEILEVHQQESRAEDLRNNAIRLYEDAGHAHGGIDVRLKQIRHSIKENYQYLTKEVLQELEEYFEFYEKNDLVAQFQGAIQDTLVHMPHWFAFDLHISLTHMTDKLMEKSGTKLLVFINQIKLLGTWLTRSGKSARVIETARGLDSHIEVEDSRWMKGMIAHNLSLAYAQLEDFDEAHSWGTKAETIWGSWFHTDRAEATKAVLQAKLRAYAQTKDTNLDGVISFAEAEIKDDISTGLILAAIQKMELIVGQILSPRSDSRLPAWMVRMEGLARELAKTRPEEGDIQLAAICQDRGLSLLVTLQSGNDSGRDDECIACFDEATALYIKRRRLMEAASSRQMQALAVFSTYKKARTIESLQRCIELISIAKDAFKAMENAKFVTTSTYWHSFYLFNAWVRGWTTSETALAVLKEAEEAWVEENADMTVFKSLESVSRKQQLSSPKNLRDTYNRAMHICLNDLRVVELWEWVQRSKARSLSDQLGVGALIPAALRDQVARDPTAKALIDQEEEIAARIASCEQAMRLRLRGELQALHKRMQEHQLLRTILDLKKGTPVTLDRIRELGRHFKGKMQGSEVAFVDWVDFNGHIWLIVCREETLRLLSCQVKIEEVVAWKKEWLDAKPGEQPAFEDEFYEEDEEEFCLRSLDRLVAPLRDVVAEGDLLVLCPTGILHSIPLHALYIVGTTPVISRHPVIYSASLTTFWQCCRRSEPANVGERTLMGVFEPSPVRRFNPAEQAAVYDSLEQLRRQHGAEMVATGQAVTKKHLADSLQRSARFHFHGHCILDRHSGALADQSLELADGQFPVREVFDLKLQSPHITLVACDSASQGLSAGDEPLGLVTALLCAGASSVIGTIWPTASGTGRDFSSQVYAQLQSQLDAMAHAQGGGIYNLATALQRAVLALRRRKDTRQPYHWAAFVLHGSWSMGVASCENGAG